LNDCNSNNSKSALHRPEHGQINNHISTVCLKNDNNAQVYEAPSMPRATEALYHMRLLYTSLFTINGSMNINNKK